MMKNATFTPTLFGAALIALLVAASAGADERGQAIAKRVDELEKSRTSKSTMEMTVRPADGGAGRTFSVRSYERGDVSQIEFTEPRAVRGLRILSKGNDSWVYFPSTGRVRKIAGSSRSGSVQGVGGDFSYDDLGEGSWAEDYEFQVLSENDAVWELEGTRKNADAAYDAVRLTVDKAIELPISASFSKQKEGGYYKRLSFKDYRNFGAKMRAAELVMENLKKGSSTVVLLKDAVYDVPLEDKLFDPSRFDK